MSVDPTVQEQAKAEILQSLNLSIFSMRQFGLSFDKPPNRRAFIKQKLILYLCFFGISYHIFSDIVNIGVTLATTPRVEFVVPLFHTFGYGALSSFKLWSVWYKKDVFEQRIADLVDIWPVPPLAPELQAIKDKSLLALRIAHRFFFGLNVSAVWIFNLTPVMIYVYESWWQGRPDAVVGFPWTCWYPFDKWDPTNHVFVYLFEILSGVTCVWAMSASDLMLTGMASHICMLLRILHQRLTSLAASEQPPPDHYRDIVSCIKLHQRLIVYCNDLEEAFSIVNLVNIVLSSINICCVVFVIVLLEPLSALSNKMFLGAALIQVGVICWYADDIYHANSAVAAAAYSCQWHKTSPSCQRALMFLIKRSQKPIALTAMNFTNINLTTFSSILYKSYSYFALLYTMYKEN
ncbi:uncharacterized protein LOC105398380 [Plutella xylostella]|uniref:Odorant receptor n=1 Tax=Plutella xylostella TaxID=51655 RepID=V9SFT8_PLUXY|nr:uncharacterized protein LOC105398380 [Plutella xylostella]AHC55206.1 lOR16 [Plutella xylostella]